MALRYFRKEIPRNPVYLADGTIVQFEKLDDKNGYLATENQTVIDSLKKLESEHRGGVFEVTQQVFETDFGKKKAASTPSAPIWREEISMGVAQDTQVQRVPALAAAAAAAEPPAPPPPPPQKKVAKAPIVGKRPVA